MSEGGFVDGSESTATTPPPPPPPPQQQHGVKRRGDDNTQEQRLSKRFNLLDLGERNSQLWTSPDNTPQQPCVTPPNQNQHATPSSSMQVDETADRIYIHDLDEEIKLAEDVPDEDRVIFLPDIERKLNKIPKHILTGDAAPPTTGNELVLYSVPSSLSIPHGDDNVRRAILETRARASDRANKNIPPHAQAQKDDSITRGVAKSADENNTSDEDAMDIG